MSNEALQYAYFGFTVQSSVSAVSEVVNKDRQVTQPNFRTSAQFLETVSFRVA
jgi:hypothetical protein